MPKGDVFDQKALEIMLAHNPKFRTICEVIREVYGRALAQKDEETQEKCLEMIAMAKRMNRRLKQYNAKWGPADYGAQRK